MTTSYPPRFDALYVISDLHLGGVGPFQVFNRGARLAGFIRRVAAERPEQDVALVLNGDVIDSLAEDCVPGYVPLDATTALALMKRLYGDPSFAAVWDALADFCRTDRRQLVFVAGNHDVELSLPIVEHSLRERLTSGDAAAQARIHFATHGAGFACRVGGARVFCTHGHETDPWNRVDHDALAQLANAMGADRHVPAARWTPNAGTRLVVDVMNPLKRRFPFVDLLKPEQAALLGVLLALDSDAFARIDLRALLTSVLAQARAQELVAQTLGPDPASDDDWAGLATRDLLRRVLEPNLRSALRVRRSEDELLQVAIDAAAGRRAGVAPAAASGSLDGLLPAATVVAGLFGFKSREEALRVALRDWLRDDATYAAGAAYDADDALCRRVGTTVDVLIAGHTHLARARRRDHGFYFNTGTWIRLLRLTPQVLADPQAFAHLWSVLLRGEMSALDTALIPGGTGDVPLLFDRTTAVRVACDAGVVVGELLRVHGEGTPAQPVTLAAEPGSAAFRRP